MFKVMKLIHERIAKEAFLPTWFSIFVNPYHISRVRLRDAIVHSSSRVNGRVLDFGCGSKPYEPLFHNASEYIGVDVEISGHDHAQSKIDVFWNLQELPFASNIFDSAVSFEVLEHVFDVDVSLSEIARVLKPGGTFLLSVPFMVGEHEVPYDFARYSTFGLHYLLQRHGFQIVQSHKLGNFMLAVAQATIDLIQRKTCGLKYFGFLVTQIMSFPITLISELINLTVPHNKSSWFFLHQFVVCIKAEDNLGTLR
jgi:SAM-dependent methyltransferase